MSYLVLARKWRPQRFDEVVGQNHVTRTLANAIEMDRVAHAFLFSGVRGVGKTSLARILAKSLNCAEGPTVNPCGSCESCRSVTAGTAVDVIEIDGASNNSVDDIRDLRETVPYRPQLGRYKIYAIDEVHMLSTSAFNALLKTLEEPPDHVKFIFATTEPHKIPVTILSRCQRYDFKRIPTAAIVERIRNILDEEKIQSEEKALNLIGREAEGSMRDALSILDQVLASRVEAITADAVAELLGVVDGRVFFDLSKAILDRNPRRTVEIIRQVDHQGYDIPAFSKGLLEHLGNLVVAGVCESDRSVLDLPDEEADELFSQAASVSNDTLHRIFKHFSESFDAIARSFRPRILLETSLARIADLGELVPAQELVQRLEALAAKGGGSSTPSGRVPSASSGSTSLSSAKKTPASQSKPELQSQAQEKEENSAPIHYPNLSDINWNMAVETIKQEKPTLASILEYGVPLVKRDSSRLTIQFAETYSAIAALAAERRGEIASSLKALIGQEINVEVEVDNSVSVPMATRKRMEQEELTRRREEEARQHPLVRQIQAKLGGTVTEVRVKDEQE